MDSVDRKNSGNNLDLNSAKSCVKKCLSLLTDRKTTVHTPNVEGRTFVNQPLINYSAFRKLVRF